MVRDDEVIGEGKASPLKQVKICMELPPSSRLAIAERVGAVVAGTTFAAIEIKGKAQICDTDKDDEQTTKRKRISLAGRS